MNRALQRLSLPLGEHTHISVNCGDLLRIAPSGEISREEFDNPFLFYSNPWFPYSWPGQFRYVQKAMPSTQNSYLEEIKSVALAFGYAPEEIDHLADIGFAPEELEELLYCGEL